MEAHMIEKLTTSDVNEFLESNCGILVDTLPPEHFAARHIPGAVNACVYEVTFLDTMAELVPDKETAIVLYGAGPHSQDSLMAVDKLTRAGYSDLATFPGGLDTWRAEGRPLEGSAPTEVEPPHPLLTFDSRVYALNPTESVIHWTGRNNNGNHIGTLGLSAGEFDVTGDDPAASFTIDMTTIRNTNLEGDELHPVLESHLHSDDFFFTNLFPEATFNTTRIRLVEEGEATRPNAMMQGELAIRGLSNEIAFPAHIRNIEDNKLAIIANLDFDRTQWGIIYGSSRFFQHLSYHVVFDFISVDFRLVLE